MKGFAMNTLTQTKFGTGLWTARTTTLPAFASEFVFRPRTLGQAIQAAVDAIDDADLKPLCADATQPIAQARAVLALLVRCYAQNIYSSAAAASLAASDADFPWFWWEALPDARALRRFRAENHEAIRRCLVAALRFQAEEKIFAGAVTRVNAPQLAEEAGRRIIVAAFEDDRERTGE
jgi:hypothetical protein